jgi:hypothetical protein
MKLNSMVFPGTGVERPLGSLQSIYNVLLVAATMTQHFTIDPNMHDSCARWPSLYCNVAGVRGFT